MSEDEARRSMNDEPTDDDVEAHARRTAMNEEAGEDADDADDVEAHARRST